MMYNRDSVNSQPSQTADDTQYKEKLDNAVSASICWIKNGTGYFTMERTVNEYLDALGANKAPGGNPELIVGRRTLGVQRIAIDAIHALDHSELHRLDDRLKAIAEDIPDNRQLSFHR